MWYTIGDVVVFPFYMTKIHKIYWHDPTTYTCESLHPPYKDFFTETVSIGEVRECPDDPNIVVVVSSVNEEDDEVDFTVIHKSLIVRAEELRTDDS